MRVIQAGVCGWLAISVLAAATTPVASLKLGPSTATLRAGASVTFSLTWVGAPSSTVKWTVASTAKAFTGSLGTVSASGVYTAPALPPVPNTVVVTATDSANTTLISSSTLTLLNPAPVITSLAPNYINTGLAYHITVNGTGFLATSKLTFNGVAVAATYVSGTQFTLTGTSALAAGTKIPITVINPDPGGATSNTANLTVDAPVSVTLTPDGRTIRCGAQLTFTAHVANNTDQAVTWLLNGAAPVAALGTITSTGLYTAPADLPATPAVTVTAVSHADPTAKATVTVNLQNPMPVVTSVNPNPVIPGNATLTINGSGFAKGATVTFAGGTLATTWVSDTKLTAAAVVTMPVGRLAAVKVTNPNPGTLTSVPVAVPVRPAVEKVSYSSAVRFLEMATFGPTPASVLELQASGVPQWLASQFQQSPAVWPDPLDPNEGVGRLQTAFFDVAMHGTDQLRQRASFALASILVASAAKDNQFEQMVGYQRLMGASAFGTYRNLLGAVTLNPAMGYFLDMVNNDKANPTKGTVANENYAREVMQLFSLGLVQLHPDGTKVLSGGATVPEYDQSAVTQMAKVMTGWTYAPDAGFQSHWTNPPYYFAPMVAFEEHHDQTQKSINLPSPCLIPAGGSAAGDLNMALDCIARQTNVAPFISYRLIQRLVMSNPSSSYVMRVADAFRQSGGNLQATLTQVLTDPEASVEGSGKLREPVLYATQLLRALNANVTSSAGLEGQSNAMGQAAMAPASVFSYFSPFYMVAGNTPPPVPAPEFQIMNATTVLARANFAYRVATNGVSGTIKVDLTNLQDLAANPADLVEAVNQALYRGEMTASERSILLGAASGSTSALGRVRSVLYAAGAAPQYEVAR